MRISYAKQVKNCLKAQTLRIGGGGGGYSLKGLMGTCGQPGYVFRDFCLKQGIDLSI